jgi:hydrophobe/amphiphile efflux-1 (HAE1) family protein
MVEQFIRRPVLSIVISIIILLVGLISLVQLPITQFPDIVPPAVTVIAKYTGANSETCIKSVAMPIERAINGTPGMTYMSTVSGNDGVTLVTVYFEVGTDPDLAAVSVQNRVSTVLDELPEEVIRAGVSTEKEVNSILMYLNILSEDPSLDESFIYNFADINILQELKRIDGVGRAEILGQKEYSMRVWLNPEKLLAYNISAQEVVDALRSHNVEAAPGKIGDNSGQGEMPLQYVLKYSGKFISKDKYDLIPIKSDATGAILRLKDVAEIELGTMSYGLISNTDGKPSATILIKQRPGSNAREIIKKIQNKMEELKVSSFPPSITYNSAYDVSRFLDASIKEVIKTLIEALILVFIVVFIFLQDIRATIITAISVPVSIIGTFAFMKTFGFSMNLLTLFALVLAIGIVVDNAIVVVEAVHAKMQEKELDAKAATIESMREIGGAIIAITLVMSAVFIPVSFLGGPAGVFYRQFSLTLAVSIFISGITALTLTPALCALLLKHSHPEEGIFGRFFKTFNSIYQRFSLKYISRVEKATPKRRFTLAITLITILASVALTNLVPSGFIPMEDQGMIYAHITTPPGSTVERTENAVQDMVKSIEKTESIENISTLSGYNLLSETIGASYGMALIGLKPWDKRNQSAEEIIDILKEKTNHIKDAKIDFFPPPTVPGFGNASGFELRILDKTGSGDLNKLSSVTNDLIKKIEQSKEASSAFTTFEVSFPQYLIQIDLDQAAKKGATIENLMSSLQMLVGSYYATNFVRFNQMYRVMIQATPKARAEPHDILKLTIKNKDGLQIPISSFVKLKKIFGPEQITRYNMYNSSLITGDAAENYSSGELIHSIQGLAKNSLPSGFDYEWSGITREEILTGGQTGIILLISIVFVYLILSAQFENFFLPLTIIFSLPAGILGTLLSLKLAGIENNIYAQVASVMLIGLLGKNAILIVEFAIQKRKAGHSLQEAAREGALSRLRPIIMTSLAFIGGLIPLVLASGAGAVGNRAIGTAAAGGMLTGTLLGIFIIPGLYFLFASISEKLTKKA